MTVRDAMTEVTLTVGPSHTLCDVAKQMSKRQVGAAIMLDPDSPGPGILTERDILKAVAAGQDPSTASVSDYVSSNLITASPGWDLERAAEVMVKNNFRHLIVIDGSELVGVIAMRDIVRAWVHSGVIATS